MRWKAILLFLLLAATALLAAGPLCNRFFHELCTGTSPDGLTRIAIEATYLRKKGQRAVSRETQEVNKGYFESQMRYEEVLAPYTPKAAP